MTSRLDRLFVLLETGSSPVTRGAAAKQLGEVQRLHPHELHRLLSRISSFLKSQTWETRIAAGQAVEAVLRNVPQWDPPGTDLKCEPGFNSHSVSMSGRLSYANFDIVKVIMNSAHLMGSEGKEYDLEEENSVCDREKLAQMRQLVNTKLGLDKINIDTSDVFSPEDLIPQYSENINQSKLNVSDIVSECSLSSREMNRARRKARQAVAKQRSRDVSSTTSAADIEEEELQCKKRIKLEDNIQNQDDGVMNEVVPDITGSWGSDAIDWPLEGFCDTLCTGLFSPMWEVRHGAATALRELIKIHGKGAGKSTDMPTDQIEEFHQLYLEDVSLRIICVLALDRFGDFISDQVVAPVRETCAQALGSIVHLMTKDRVEKVLLTLLQLLNNTEWEARHGGLLGVKYLLAIRQDMVSSLLRLSLPYILAGLSDAVDDVGAVAALALIPVASDLVSMFSEQVPVIVKALWDLLADQDELAASCNGFMGLLAALLSIPKVQNVLNPDPCVIARLWPFLTHNTSSVRRATLQTVRILTSQKETSLQWPPELLQEAMRHIFQRALVEHIQDTLNLVEQVWNNLVHNSNLETLLIAACPYVSSWLCLTMQPAKLAFEPGLLIENKTTCKDSKNRRNKAFALLDSSASGTSELKLYVGGNETIPIAQRESNVVGARCMAARMLGVLSCYIVKPAPGICYTADIEPPIDCYVKVLLVYLNSKSAIQRLVAGLVIAEWASISPPNPCPELLISRLQACLTDYICFDELALSFSRLLQDTKDFIATLKHYKLPLDQETYNQVLTLDQIQQLSGSVAQQLLTSHKLKPKVAESLEERRKSIQGAVSQTSSDQQLLTITTQAALVGAVLMLKCLPEKLNPVVKPLMDAIKREENEQLQNLAAKHLAYLVEMCLNRTKSPNTKIISNLCTFLCSDPEFTPKIINGSEGCSKNASEQKSNNLPSNQQNLNYYGILTLLNQQKDAERAIFRRSNSTGGRGPGRPPISDIPLEELFSTEDESQKSKKIQRRGATFALTAIVCHFGAELPTKLPVLWESIVVRLSVKFDVHSYDPKAFVDNDSAAEDLVSCLQVIEVTSPAVHPELLPKIFSILQHLLLCLSYPYRAVRNLSSRCIAVFATLDSVTIMSAVVEKVLPLLGASDCVTRRQGAAECLACISDKLKYDVIPYIVLLIVPLLGRMSDQDTSVRLAATHCFASLIQLMPLDGGVPNPPNMTLQLTEQKAKDKEFLEQLFNPKTIPDYKVPVPIRASLRSYQQAGVNWLALLNKYKLHGILCDDMGLGKTLQSICILAGDHFDREVKFKATKSVDSCPLPSLVICPPTLTGHWMYEVEKFLSPLYLNPLQYAGPPSEREKLRSRVELHNLVIASYDIVRKDIEFFSSIKWNYCILDEGHVIKNGKTKSSKAIKQLIANHRLILSGTPIQNNVLELWSLFDFLMPGFLGTERQFTAKYSRPILASRDPKSSHGEQEAGVMAMEALHRQVLPFVLRRMKEDVLKDLPPKITQDYYCELSPLQEQLYEDFSKCCKSLTETLECQQNNLQNNTHIFQALRYLQNVCNHPKLVLTTQHPEFDRINEQLKKQNTSLADIQHAAKLPALKQLLLDCGIGVTSSEQSSDLVINQHRALIFCQIKSMLDIVENDLLKAHMPSVTYLRLDGSILPGSRHAVVTQFNSDPSIDVLLLTTQVGGLGLNLTGADTVIFVEHDWSPMRDLQAMDRAHRIGQKKVVNVYRLITKSTLEEKIMGLQKFKLMTANTVISSENASLQTMGTDKLLDLFSLENKQPNWATTSRQSSSGSLTVKTIIDSLPDLWDEKCYEEEYDLTNFVKNLRQ
uniref:TATA-binding protein-associated factor 172 n=1 Tax=Clastoptera arizonana TaxID=38151 RepID=A0A1B6DFE2_9HEMI